MTNRLVAPVCKNNNCGEGKTSPAISGLCSATTTAGVRLCECPSGSLISGTSKESATFDATTEFPVGGCEGMYSACEETAHRI